MALWGSELGDSMQFDFKHFVGSQREAYRRATAELRQGRKITHWMWYIFPQLAGLGTSEMSQRFGLSSLAEASAYLVHPVLGERLLECVELLQDLPTSDAVAVFGTVDAMKLHSSLTLFALADPERKIFKAALDRWFKGESDPLTLALLTSQQG